MNIPENERKTVRNIFLFVSVFAVIEMIFLWLVVS